MIVDALPADQQYLLLFISNHSGVLVFKGMQHLRVMNNCNLMIREVQEQDEYRNVGYRRQSEP